MSITEQIKALRQGFDEVEDMGAAARLAAECGITAAELKEMLENELEDGI